MDWPSQSPPSSSSPAAPARRRAPAWARGALWLLALLAVLALPFLLKNYRVFQLNLVLVYAIAVLGLNLLTGFNGQFSLGHGAFYAVGAYTAAVLIERAGWPYGWTLPAAGALSFALGVAVGFPALRLAGPYLALATYALALAVPQLLKSRHLEAWTGGVQGLVLAKPEAPFALSLWGRALSADRWLYLVALAVAALMFWLAANLLRGRIGRALLAIRDQPTAAAAMGINLPRYKTLAFGIAAAYAGVAGALGALCVGFVSPDSFTALLSITLLVGAVVGGLQSLAGALFGALFIQFVPNLTDALSKSAPWAVYGAVLIAAMALLPGGVVGGLRSLRLGLARRMRQHRGRASPRPR